MRNILILAAVAFFAACNSSQPAPTETAAPAKDSTVREINSPYPVSYSSKFAIGDPKNAESILTLWKDYENGNILSGHKELFADSIELYLSDGTIIRGRRDSVIAIVQQHRNMASAVVDRVDAVTALRSTDKNENWVLIWGMEKTTAKNGKVDSVNLQETWRLNNDGKVNLLYQYVQAAAPPKKLTAKK